MIRLLSIGVETYQDSAQHTVAFAENDAIEVAKAWANIYGNACESLTIISSQATRGRVLNELNSLAGRTAPTDTVIFYFAGHGFNTGGRNLLSLNDTFMATLEATAISFETVYGTLWDVRPQKLMLFMDACHSGFELSDSRGVVQMFAADELRMIDRDSNVAVSFASCSQGEESYPYPAERHGCWTYHLLRALRGEEPTLLHDGEVLRAMALQEHLASEVPALVRNLRRGAARQSPRIFGSMNQDFIVADLGVLLAAKSKVDDHFISIVDHVALVGLDIGSVRYLSGFRRGHRVPDQVNSATQEFVINIGSEEIKALQAELYEALHAKLQIKYSDMTVHESRDGFRIICPAFDVQADLAQSAENPKEYEIRTSVDDFREPAVLRTAGFAQVFDSHLDQIEVSFKKHEDLDQVVKRLESSKYKGSFTYQRGQEISLQLDTLSASISRDALTLRAPGGGLEDLLALASNALSAISAGSLLRSLGAPAAE